MFISYIHSILRSMHRAILRRHLLLHSSGLSSELSVQSSDLSQTHEIGIHLPLSHRNCLRGQATLPGNQREKKGTCTNLRIIFGSLAYENPCRGMQRNDSEGASRITGTHATSDRNGSWMDHPGGSPSFFFFPRCRRRAAGFSRENSFVANGRIEIPPRYVASYNWSGSPLGKTRLRRTN